MSDVLTRIREKYPVYAEIPDDKLVEAIGRKYPQYLERPDFKSEFDTVLGKQDVKHAEQLGPSAGGSIPESKPEPSDAGRIEHAQGLGPSAGATIPETDYGKRADGTTKGEGFLGPLKRPDGQISTELSIGVDFDGKETEIPSLVPTLTPDEVNHLLSGAEPTKEIVDKAVAHARKRINEGNSPFAQAGEQKPKESNVAAFESELNRRFQEVQSGQSGVVSGLPKEIPSSAVETLEAATKIGIKRAQQILPTILGSQVSQLKTEKPTESDWRQAEREELLSFRERNLRKNTLGFFETDEDLEQKAINDILSGTPLDPNKLSDQERFDQSVRLRAEGKKERRNAIMDVWTGVASEYQSEINRVPQSKAQRDMAEARTQKDKWKVFSKYPGQTIASIVLESLPPAVAGAIVGSGVGGPGFGTAAGAGLASAGMEYSSTLLSEATQAGYDTANQESLAAFLNSPAYDEASKKAMIRAGIIGSIDATTGGTAGMILAPAVKQGLMRVVAAGVAETGVQALGGMGGEFLGQAATRKPGEEFDWFDIAMEGVAEGPTAIFEAGANVAGKSMLPTEAEARASLRKQVIERSVAAFEAEMNAEFDRVSQQSAADFSLAATLPEQAQREIVIKTAAAGAPVTAAAVAENQETLPKGGDKVETIKVQETPGGVQERLGTQPEWVSSELKTKLSEADKQGSPFKVDVTNEWKSLTPQQRQELLASGWSVTQGRGNEVLIGLSQDVGPNRLRKKVQSKGGDLSERKEKGQEGDEVLTTPPGAAPASTGAAPDPTIEELFNSAMATTPEQAKEFKGFHVGGYTGLFWQVGSKARTADDVDKLKRLAVEENKKSRELFDQALAEPDPAKKDEMLGQVMKQASRQPSEAYEYATGETLEGTPKWMTFEKRVPGYVPSVPGPKYLEAHKPAPPAKFKEGDNVAFVGNMGIVRGVVEKTPSGELKVRSIKNPSDLYPLHDQWKSNDEVTELSVFGASPYTLTDLTESIGKKYRDSVKEEYQNKAYELINAIRAQIASRGINPDTAEVNSQPEHYIIGSITGSLSRLGRQQYSIDKGFKRGNTKTRDAAIKQVEEVFKEAESLLAKPETKPKEEPKKPEAKLTEPESLQDKDIEKQIETVDAGLIAGNEELRNIKEGLTPANKQYVDSLKKRLTDLKYQKKELEKLRSKMMAESKPSKEKKLIGKPASWWTRENLSKLSLAELHTISNSLAIPVTGKPKVFFITDLLKEVDGLLGRKTKKAGTDVSEWQASPATEPVNEPNAPSSRRIDQSLIDAISTVDSRYGEAVLDFGKLEAAIKSGKIKVSRASEALLLHLIKQRSEHPLESIRLHDVSSQGVGFQGRFRTTFGSRIANIEVALRNTKGEPILQGTLVTILNHELLHNAVTSKLRDATALLRADANKLFEFVKGQAEGTEWVGHNALADVEEFFAEALSRKKFRDWLAKVDYTIQSETTTLKERKNSAFGRILDIVKRLLKLPDFIIDAFGMKVDTISALEEAVDISSKLEDIIRQAATSPMENFAEAEEEGGAPASRDIKLEADMNQLINLLGPSLYSNSISNVTVKELLQNGFDAVRMGGATYENPGHISITTDAGTKTITVTDDGVGMAPDVIQKAFFTIGGTHKTGRPEDTSGGLGIAKMAFILGSKSIRLVTTHNGVTSTVDATSAQIRSQSFRVEVERTPGKPNGTTVAVVIPDSYTDSNGEVQEVYFDERPYFLKQPLIGPVEVTFNGEVLPMGVHFKDFQIDNEFTFDWGQINVWINPTKKRNASVRVLSAGLYQFDHHPWGYGSDATKFDYDLVLDVRPKVRTSNPAYPFNNQREGWRSTVKEDVEAMDAFLKRMSVQQELLQVRDSLETMEKMPQLDMSQELSEEEVEAFYQQRQRREQRKTGAGKAGPRVTNVDFSGDRVTITYGNKKTETVPKEEYVKKSFKPKRDVDFEATALDASQMNPQEPLFNNNTTADISDIPGARNFFAELGNTLIGFMREFGEKVGDSYELLGDTTPEGWFGGISLDKNYRGLNSVKPIRAIWINPALLSGDAREAPDAAAYETLHLFIHEITHVAARSEGAYFTAELATNHARLRSKNIEIEKAERLLEKIYAKYWQAFTTLNERINDDYNTNNRAESFKSSDSAGPDPGAARQTPAGVPPVNAPGAEQVSEPGRGGPVGSGKGNPPTGSLGAILEGIKAEKAKPSKGKQSDIFEMEDEALRKFLDAQFGEAAPSGKEGDIGRPGMFAFPDFASFRTWMDERYNERDLDGMKLAFAEAPSANKVAYIKLNKGGDPHKVAWIYNIATGAPLPTTSPPVARTTPRPVPGGPATPTGGPPPTTPPAPRPPRPATGRVKFDIMAMVQFLRLFDKYPRVNSRLRAALGRHLNTTGQIEIMKNLLMDPELAARVLAHESGHFIDLMLSPVGKGLPFADRLAPLRAFRYYIQKRKEWRNEAKSLSRAWRGPFTDNDKYRNSAKELFADFMSAMMNEPEWVNQNYPILHDAFAELLAGKPSFRLAYDEMVRWIEGGTMTDEWAKQQDAAVDKTQEILLADKPVNKVRPIDWLKGALVSTWYRGYAKEGYPRELGDKLTDELEYSSLWAATQNALFADDFMKKVQPKLDIVNPDKLEARKALHKYSIAVRTIGERRSGGVWIENHPAEARALLTELLNIDPLLRAQFLGDLVSATNAQLYDLSSRIIGAIHRRDPTGKKGFVKKMTKAIDEMALGVGGEEAMMAFNVRGKMLNPGGLTEQQAQKYLAELHDSLTPAQWNALEDAARQLRNLFYDTLDAAYNEGLFSQKTWNEIIAPNRNYYVPYAVLDYFDGRMTSGLKKQVGTVKDIADIVMATQLKVSSLNAWRQKARQVRLLMDVYQKGGTTIPVGERLKSPFDIERIREENKTDDISRAVLWQDGKPYLVEFPGDPDKSFEKAMDSAAFYERMRWMSTLNKWTHGMMQLYTTFSLPFMIYRNPTRGAQTAVARTGVKAVGKVGAREAWDLLKALSTGGAHQPGLAARMALNYAEAAFGGELIPEVRDLVEQQILLPPRISSAMVRDIENLTELLSDGGILAFQIEQAKAGKWPWWKKFAPTRESIKFAERVFTAYEAFEKIVNYQAAQGRGLSDDTAKAIARRAGIPKPGVGGSATMPMEVLFPFLRVTIQGYRASLETLKDPEVGKGYATRVAAFSFAPRIFKIGIGMGVAAGLIKWMMHPDEDDEDPVMAEVMRRVNPYKMALDNTFPLMLYDSRTGKYHYFWDFKSGKSIPSHFEVVSLRIPDSEEGRTWGPLLYNLLTSMPKVEVGQNTKEGWKKAFEIPSTNEKMGRPGENPVTSIARWAVNEATPSRSPVFEVSGNLFSMTFKGENPPDEFRGGQPSANKMLFDAGWGEGRGEAILGYTLNQLGFAGDVASTMMMNMGMLDQKASSALKQRLASDKTPLIERIPALKSAFSYDNYASYRDEESARLEEVKIRARLRANLPPEVKEIYDFYWKNYKRQEKLDVIDRLKFNVSKDLMNGWGKINDPTSMFSTIGHAFGKDGSKMARDSAIEHIERLAAPKVAKWKMIIDMQSE